MNESESLLSLDLFSTTPTKEEFCSDFLSQICSYNAPYFAYEVTRKQWTVVQGCCNHWDCPRCGQQRAKQEYGRIVEGCRELAKNHTIYFITITCRGSDITQKEAENGYGEWTNRLLDAARQRCKRSLGSWHYVQVTERQKRGHPHSHILTTFDCGDLYTGYVEKWTTENSGKRKMEQKPTLRSHWLSKAVKRAGLGEQYDVSIAGTIEGASRYVAKYLFKETIFTDTWPKGWKRVRYSQSFPKLPERETNAVVLLKHEDWDNLAGKALIINTQNQVDFTVASHFLQCHDCFVRLKEVQTKK